MPQPNEILPRPAAATPTHSGVAVQATRRIRAPRQSGQLLALPDLNSIAEVVSSNIRLIKSWQLNIAGKPLAALQPTARQHLLKVARQYSSRYRDLVAFPSSGPVILAGHQPTLFHPGVWIKNFAASLIAQQVGGTALNLVVDNDLAASHMSLVVPDWDSRGRLFRGNILLDRPAAELPFENRLIQDGDCFNSIPSRATAAIRPWVSDPIAQRLNQHWISARDPEGRWGASVAAARHALEGELGLETAELPISLMAQSEPFAWFVQEILTRIIEFHSAHQRALDYYRAQNHVRSTAHPVPDLKVRDQWWETPFWVWRPDQPRRQPLFVQPIERGLNLSDLQDWQVDWAGNSWLDFWQHLLETGVAIRPRAITTTLFSRLLLCDLFIHGIGGAKYDEITDALFVDFWQIPPPQFLTLTATMTLPLGFDDLPNESLNLIQSAIRSANFHGERLANQVDPAQREAFAVLQKHKSQLLQSVPERKQRKSWQREMENVNRQLSEHLRTYQQEQHLRLEQLIARSPQAQVAQWREFSFALHPQSLSATLIEQIALGLKNPAS